MSGDAPGPRDWDTRIHHRQMEIRPYLSFNNLPTHKSHSGPAVNTLSNYPHFVGQLAIVAVPRWDAKD